jgi:hypothetical protein
MAIRKLFDSNSGRIGGVGLKIHPDYIYANLYHWLVGDKKFYKGFNDFPLPFPNRPFNTGPGEKGKELTTAAI